MRVKIAQNFLKASWNRGDELFFLAARKGDEKASRVEHERRARKVLVAFSVNAVAKNRAAKIFHVHADLVCPPCSKSDANERICAICGKAAVIGHGALSFVGFGCGLEFFSVGRVTDNLRFYDSAFFFRDSRNDEDIFFFCAVSADLLLKDFLGVAVFRCDYDA